MGGGIDVWTSGPWWTVKCIEELNDGKQKIIN